MHTLSSQKLKMATIDERVTNMLRFMQKLARSNEAVVYGDGAERVSEGGEEDRAFLRKLAAEGIVLLRNERGVLPLGQEKAIEGEGGAKKKRILVTGPNVHANVISGGGSAQLKPTYIASPLQSIKEALPEGYEVDYTVGCYGLCTCLSCTPVH